MSAQHTPGPWFIWQELALQREGMEPDEIADELVYDSEYGVYAGDPDECTRGSMRGHSAHICDIDADALLDFDDDEKQSNETALANARLIAAAPDLLWALQEMLAKACGEWHPSHTEKARAAIAKATGATK